MNAECSHDVGTTTPDESAPQSQPLVAGMVQVAASTEEVARVISGIWREVLHLERLEQGDNFFDRGGSSLLAVKVTARILSALGVEIALRDLFRHPTLAQFTGVVAERRRNALEGALLRSDEQDRQELMDRVMSLSTEEVAALNQSLKKG